MKRTVTIEVELGQYEFQCEKCKKIHKESAYCIEQRASGVEIVHTCDCKNKTILKPYR